jgi:hypothetical protein
VQKVTTCFGTKERVLKFPAGEIDDSDRVLVLSFIITQW